MRIPFFYLILFLSSIGVYSTFGQKLPEQYSYIHSENVMFRGVQDEIGFYALNNLDTLFIEFEEKNYEWLMADNYYFDRTLMARLTYKGILYDSVAVGYRGHTSFHMNTTSKKSFKIDLGHNIKDQNIEGYSTFHLNANLHDPSFMKEVLYSLETNRHTIGAKTNYKILMVNGISYGLYINIQNLDKKLSSQWVDSKGHKFFRAEYKETEYKAQASNFGMGQSSMNYLGDIVLPYKNWYNQKGKEDKGAWLRLIEMTKQLDQFSTTSEIESLNKYLDIDAALWFLAYEILFTDEDGYVSKGGSDYFLLMNGKTGKFTPVEYDGNSCLSRHIQWPLYYQDHNKKLPLVQKLLGHEVLRQRYLAHVRTILASSFDSVIVDAKIDVLKDLIAPYIEADEKGIYSFDTFSKEVDILKKSFAMRREFLQKYPELQLDLPKVSKVTCKLPIEGKGRNFKMDSVDIQFNLSPVSQVEKVLVHFKNDQTTDFEKKEFKLSEVVINGDLVSIKIPIKNERSTLSFYLEIIVGDDYSSRVFSPAGATHDVYHFSISTLVNTEKKGLIINELMPYNKREWKNEEGVFSDWIELFNTTDKNYSIGGLYLSNDILDLKKWKIPKTKPLLPGTYKVIGLDKKSKQKGIANFNLSNKGGALFLSDRKGTILYTLIYNSRKSNQSYSRCLDGNYRWQKISPGGVNN